jgi:hypothetical protein
MRVLYKKICVFRCTDCMAYFQYFWVMHCIAPMVWSFLSTTSKGGRRRKRHSTRCCLSSMQSSSGICSQTRSAYLGGVSAVLYRLVVPARPAWIFASYQMFTAANISALFLGKIKNPTRLISVLSLPFKFVHNHKSWHEFSCNTFEPLNRGRPHFWPKTLKITNFSHGEYVGGGGGQETQSLPAT